METIRLLGYRAYFELTQYASLSTAFSDAPPDDVLREVVALGILQHYREISICHFDEYYPVIVPYSVRLIKSV